MFRHILASLHFNENIHRETKLSKDGEKYYAVTYPKFKLGEEVVREVASPPTYGKLHVHDLTFYCFFFPTVFSRNIYKTRHTCSVSLHFPEKRVENVTHSGVFSTEFKVFGN